MRVQLQPAYILHQRPFRDTSSLLELFTAEHGRISLVGKGVRRRSRGGSSAALMQPFTPLLVSFTGLRELKTLTHVEAAGAAARLRGDRLYSAMYLNELLVRLLHRHDPHPTLFASYGDALERLGGEHSLADILRRFELNLLAELGYSFSLSEDGRSGEPLDAGLCYLYDVELGLVTAPRGTRGAFSGADLLAIGRGEFSGPAGPAAKRLMRLALAEQLGPAPLRSRELFRRSPSGGESAD